MAEVAPAKGTRKPLPYLAHATAVAVVAAVIMATQFEPATRTASTEPVFWLLTALAVLAAWQAFVAPGPGGGILVLSASTAFIFAILLSWGLGAAILAQMIAMIPTAWRYHVATRVALLDLAYYVISFAAAFLVLGAHDRNPFGNVEPPDLLGDAVAIAGAVAAWLAVYVLLATLAAWTRSGRVLSSTATGLAGFFEVPYRSALLLLSPMLSVAAHGNIAFVVPVLVPLYAVQRMGRLSAELHGAAQLDSLTGLANRIGLRHRFDVLSAGRHSDPHRRLALMMLDLDRFKYVNDALGHHIGDQLLIAVAARLSAAAPADGMVARIGGDEFAVLARVRNTDEACSLADRLVQTLSEPVILDGLSFDITASVGIAVDRDRAEDFATLLRHADLVMYKAKRRGDSTAVYDPQADHDISERLSLLTDLRQALEADDRAQIEMHYQPQTSLRTGQVVGVEALLRWTHPVHGPIKTPEVIQIAEHTPVMQLLTRRVIEHVVEQVARWDAHGVTLRGSLNVSARDLYSEDIVSHVASRLAQHNVPACQIQVEITESALMADPDRALATTRRLSELGVAIALDDYGMGYSSLHRLRVLPPTELKIDQSLVAGMANSRYGAAIVASTVEMAHALGLRAVAEGVEDELTRSQLADIGCDIAQGWLIGHPVPGDQIPALLKRLNEHGIRRDQPQLPSVAAKNDEGVVQQP